MGGARRFPFPKWVYTPYGGWWPNHPNSSGNAVIAGGVWLFTLASIWSIGKDNTTKYNRANNSVTFSPNDDRTHAVDPVLQYRLQLDEASSKDE